MLAELVTIEELIEEQVQAANAWHLRSFLPVMREDDDEVRVINIKQMVPMSSEDLAHTSPEGSDIYRQIWSVRRGDGLWIDFFVRGLSALGPFIEEDQHSLLVNILETILEAIEREERYPTLVAEYGEIYSKLIHTVLTNGEISTREQLLAYNYGIWWLLGHLRNADKAVVLDNGVRYSLPVWLEKILTDRAQKAILEDYNCL